MINAAWRSALRSLLDGGMVVSPRGQDTLELPHRTVAVDALRAVLTEPERRLSHRFMAAEALWIIEGRDDLASLLPYARRMAEFSDDGVTLAGAYGPRIGRQLPYVVSRLASDPDTRQATLTVWTPSPSPSKDVPCTVAIDFKVRGGRLNAHVFMRSSDVWLGLPYDLSSFALLTAHVVGLVRGVESNATPDLAPGTVYLTAASSHLYLRDRPGAERVLASQSGPEARPLPAECYAAGGALRGVLARVRDRAEPGWWL
jgi:thymidylate synthase